jgi:hypothetical protein
MRKRGILEGQATANRFISYLGERQEFVGLPLAQDFFLLPANNRSTLTRIDFADMMMLVRKSVRMDTASLVERSATWMSGTGHARVG